MTTVPISNRAALIVCGGQSRRMGQAKPHLPFGDDTMLGRIVWTVSNTVAEVVLLTAKVQELPEIDCLHSVMPDRVEQQGPAASIYDGMKTVFGWADAIVVLGCDVPLVTEETIEFLFAELQNHDAVIPRHEGFPQPLAAVYSLNAMEKIGRVLDTGNQRLLSCIEPLDTRWVDAEELSTIDPQLGILHNVNTPDAYREALSKAGLKHPLDD